MSEIIDRVRKIQEAEADKIAEAAAAKAAKQRRLEDLFRPLFEAHVELEDLPLNWDQSAAYRYLSVRAEPTFLEIRQTGAEPGIYFKCGYSSSGTPCIAVGYVHDDSADDRGEDEYLSAEEPLQLLLAHAAKHVKL